MKRKRGWVGAALLGVVALVGGCTADREMMAQRAANSSVPLEAKTARASGGPFAPGGAAVAVPQSPEGKDAMPRLTLTNFSESEPDRYLIKNANVTVETKDAKQATDKLIAAVRTLKGYVSDMHETVDGLGARAVTIQVRVPFTQFEATLQQIESLGKTLDKKVNAQDVTEEFVDTQAKVRNLKNTETRLLEHLSRTGKLTDTLLVEKELNRVRELIEQLEGRVRFLAHRIQFSTFDIILQEAARPQSITPPETFSAGKVTTDATRSLIGFIQVVWTGLLWILIWSVVWLPPALLLWFVRRTHRTTMKG